MAIVETVMPMKKASLCLMGDGADEIAGLEVLRGVAGLGGSDTDHAADGDGKGAKGRRRPAAHEKERPRHGRGVRRTPPTTRCAAMAGQSAVLDAEHLRGHPTRAVRRRRRDHPVQHADRHVRREGGPAPSPRATPWSPSRPSRRAPGILRLAELLVDAFPPGVLNVVAGLGEVGDAFVRHEAVRKVTMTGSSPTAKLIQKAAADTLTPSIFELGGKSPNIVFADADLDLAAFGCTIPSVYTFNAGQACVAGSRILIQRPVLDEMLERIQAIAESITIGDPLDPATEMGPLISQQQYDKVVDYLEIGNKEAELVFGGRHGAEVVPEPAERPLGRADAVPHRRQLHPDLPGGGLRSGRRRHPLRHRGGGGRHRQRLPLRPGVRRVDPRPRLCPAHDPRHPVRQRVGQQLHADPRRAARSPASRRAATATTASSSSRGRRPR